MSLPSFKVMFCRGTQVAHIEATEEAKIKLELNPESTTICDRNLILEPPTAEATDAILEEKLCKTCRKSRRKLIKLASQAPCHEEVK